jgi:hypothetical protein
VQARTETTSTLYDGSGVARVALLVLGLVCGLVRGSSGSDIVGLGRLGLVLIVR